MTVLDRLRELTENLPRIPPWGTYTRIQASLANTILIVDDDDLILYAVERELKDLGYLVIAAKTGATAITLLSEEQPAIAIIDLRLPDVDGMELLEGIRRFSNGVACVIYTSYWTAEEAARAMNLGAIGCIAKLNLDGLRAKVESVIRQRRILLEEDYVP